MLNWEAVVDRHVPIRKAARGWSGQAEEVSPVDFLALDRVTKAEEEVERSPYGWRVKSRIACVLRLTLYRVEVSSLFPVDTVRGLEAAEKYLWTAWLESMRLSCSPSFMEELSHNWNYKWHEVIYSERCMERALVLSWLNADRNSLTMRELEMLSDARSALEREKLYWELAGAALAGGVLVDVLSTLEAGVPLEYVVGE